MIRTPDIVGIVGGVIGIICLVAGICYSHDHADQQSLLDRNLDRQFTDQVLTFHGTFSYHFFTVD